MDLYLSGLFEGLGLRVFCRVVGIGLWSMRMYTVYSGTGGNFDQLLSAQALL